MTGTARRRRCAHTPWRWIALALGLAALAGCPAGESERCRTLCKSVVACVDSLNQDSVVIDENECTVTCTSLDRDPEGKTQVDAYAECISHAADCEAKLACKSAPPPTTLPPGPGPHSGTD